jgi:hypothetical protein
VPTVKVGFFPLDERLYLGAHHWSPETVKHIVRQGTEIPSHRRAAASFEGMTKIPISKSSLGRLVTLYGSKIVLQQAAEAEAMVKPPAKEEVITVREMPRPDSEVMAISMDGALVNIRGEGWKEVKTVSVSAVETVTDEETGEIEVHLRKHSYRAGLWEAKEFAQQQWAEGCRRGLERAKQIVSVNAILSGYRASIPRESRNIEVPETFRALLAAKRLGKVRLPGPSAREW